MSEDIHLDRDAPPQTGHLRPGSFPGLGCILSALRINEMDANATRLAPKMATLPFVALSDDADPL